MDRKWLQEVGDQLRRGSSPPPITTRQLLARFDAQRRGSTVVEEVRKQLRAHGIATTPDFATAWIDQTLLLVPSSSESDPGEPNPWVKQLEEVVSQLDQGLTPAPITVKALLRWFDAERRGSDIVANIQSTLAEFGLRTEPNFRDTYIDAEVAFVRSEKASTGESVAGDVAEPSSAPPESGTGLPTDEQGGKDAQSATGGDTQGSEPGLIDPTFRIGTLRTANLKSVGRLLIRVSPNATICEAVTLMLAHNVAQLPVMQGDKYLRGVVTWQSIGTHLSLGLGAPTDQVHKCMQAAHVTRPESSLFAAVPGVVENDYVLIKDAHDTVTGIVTANDINEQFCELTEPFLLLGEIENYVRVLIERGAFTAAELASTQSEHDKREIKNATDLTLGQLLGLLRDPANWTRLRLVIDRKTFVQELDEVRKIRNDVMHFRPDRLADEKLDKLRRFARFAQGLRRAHAI